MTAPGRSPFALVDGRKGPAIIAHGGGNTTASAHESLHAAADYLEVDLWLHKGRFEARHERRVRWLPILIEKWYLRRVPSAHFGLDELFQEAHGHGAGLFLDLKNGGPASAHALRRAIAAASPSMPIVASSQQWLALRAVREFVPQVEAFYSIDVRAKLELLFSVMDRDNRPAGVSCRHTLLSESIVRRLHDRGLAVVAWTVDDLERARELVSWGVDGLTTHRVAEMHAEFIS